MSAVLIAIFLGILVGLVYMLSAALFIGVTDIWRSVPTGWALADIVFNNLYSRHVREIGRLSL